jgi:hypothetical protein
MTIKSKLALCCIASGGLVVASCSPNDTTLGATVRHNIAAQTVDPDPKYEGDHTTNGDVIKGAQERYRTDRVKKPKTIRTTEGGGGSGRGSGN